MTAPAPVLRPTETAVVEVRDVAVRFGQVVALDGVDLQVRPGEFVCILGPSGSGKSTLLRCLNGLQQPDRGQLRIDGGDPCTSSVEGRLLRARIGFIFQNFNLVGRLSVLTNVLTGALGRVGPVASLLHVFPRAVRRQALVELQQLGLADRATTKARLLSGGQQQRVAIARALMQDPLLVLADEPVASLDPKLAAGVLAELKRLARERDIPVIVSIHVVALARRFADRIVAMSDGRVVYDGPVDGYTEEEVTRTYGTSDEYGSTSDAA